MSTGQAGTGAECDSNAQALDSACNRGELRLVRQIR